MRKLITVALVAASLVFGAGTAQAASEAQINDGAGWYTEFVEDFPGGLNVHMYNVEQGQELVLTCRDWDTTGFECNADATVKHYMFAAQALNQD